MAQALTVPARAEHSSHELYLETFINGVSTELIGHFHENESGQFTIDVKELHELGLQAPRSAIDANGLVNLGRLPGLSFHYNPAAQTMALTVPEHLRTIKHMDADVSHLRGSYAGRGEKVPSVPSAVLNYLVFGTTDTGIREFFNIDGRRGALSAALDGRISGSYGLFKQSGILSAASDGVYGSVRLDTSMQREDQDQLITYRAGDVITGGLAWTRPIRIGGIQAQRSFSLRPDLITMPIPGLNASAAVPSTVDVLLNNARIFSQQVSPGPFQIDNLPIVTGAGTQTLVLRDALGRETITSAPFYASTLLLRPGLSDFSFEAGFPRLSYGLASNDYDSNPVVSASLRHGLTEKLTLETHIEGGGGLINGGMGAAFPLGAYGVAAAALAGSSMAGSSGALASLSAELGFKSITLFARSQRTLGDYLDSASLGDSTIFNGTFIPISLRPPKALDQLVLTLPSKFHTSTFNVSFTHLREADNIEDDIASFSYSRPIRKNASVFANVFSDFGDDKSVGALAGLTMALSDGISLSANGTGGTNSAAGGVEIAKSQPLNAGTYGWRARDYEGETPDRLLAASYRTSATRIGASIEQAGDNARVSGELEGSLAAANGNVFFANRIDDSFAIVDVGAPNVGIFYENRFAGTSNGNGQLLIPYVRSNQENNFAIDPANLPLDAQIPRTKFVAITQSASANVIKFDVAANDHAAIIILRDTSNAFLPPGLHGYIEGGEKFVTGYDGQAYLHGLKPYNTLIVQNENGANCKAAFAFDSLPGQRLIIDNVICR
jgi:outer membrane usher protein